MSGAPQVIGVYVVDREIGRGGMGVVYLARDSRLDRSVAIKALPDHLATDPDRLARFEREAKSLAALSHRNVAGIYGVEEHEGHRYLVLEFVDGETLADRLERGPLSVEDAIDVCVQIASGVEAAHEAGVIHRDLKPQNVKITSDGIVKVLDFGLAKASEGAEGSSIATATLTLPTTPHSPTMAGAILGTAPYMSPEQARGRRVDKRTDIWSFGVILYECLAGIGPFVGETATDSIGAILHKQIDLGLLPPDTPPAVRRVLGRCMERDKARRLRDIGDARLELEGAGNEPTGASEQAPRRAGPLWLAIAGVAVMLAAAAGWMLRPMPRVEEQPVRRLTISLPQDFEVPGWVGPVISPDGRQIATMARVADRWTLMVRDMDQIEFREIDDGWLPFFSPDGESIAYFSNDDKLKKKSIRGGPSIALCDASSGRGGVWSESGDIVFAPDQVGGLMVIPASGGTARALTSPEKKTSHRFPTMLPGGRGVLFTEATDNAAWDEVRVMCVPMEGGEPRVLIEGGTQGVYVPTGHIIYQREESLMAAPFDLGRLEVVGASVPVLDGVTEPPAAGAPAQFSIDRFGTLVYMTGTGMGNREVVRFGMDGKREALSKRTGEYSSVVPSADGRFLCLEMFDQGDSRIAILELGRDVMRTVPAGESRDDANPIWSPDGRWIVFSSNEGPEPSNLYRVRSDLTGERERLTTSEQEQFAGDWSADGRAIVFSQEATGGNDIYMLRLNDDGSPAGEPVAFAEAPGWQWSPRFSPDGRWISYSSAESEKPEVYVKPTSGDGPVVQVSTDGAQFAAWAPDGTRIYLFRRSPVRLYSVDYEVKGDEFVPQLPVLLAEVDSETLPSAPYILSDGTGFVASSTKPDKGQSTVREPTIVVNWFEELRGRIGDAGAKR